MRHGSDGVRRGAGFSVALPLEILTSLVTITLFGVPLAYLAAVCLGIPAYLRAPSVSG